MNKQQYDCIKHTSKWTKKVLALSIVTLAWYLMFVGLNLMDAYTVID